MPGQAIAMEAVIEFRQQPPDPVRRRRFFGMPKRIAGQQFEESFAIHAARLAGRGGNPDPTGTDQKASPKPAEKLKPSSENPKSARKSAARSTVARALTP